MVSKRAVAGTVTAVALMLAPAVAHAEPAGPGEAEPPASTSTTQTPAPAAPSSTTPDRPTNMPPATTASPTSPSSTGPTVRNDRKPSHIVDDQKAGPQERKISVYSAAMGRVIPLTVLRPRDTSTPAPVLYLLNGAGGGEDDATWRDKTDYVKFFSDKQVNVVTPVGGAFSYYTDWEKDDPTLGRNKWQTFLTKELPPLLDATLKTTGRNAIAGISMAGTSVLNLAIAAPELYRSVAAYSGCARTSDPLGQAYIRTVVGDRGRADVTNMWGPLDGPGWKANDPYLHAAKLRGTKVYLTTGTGLPGEYDTLGARLVAGDPLVLANQVLMGGAIEATVSSCTAQMRDALSKARVDTTVITRPAGTHSWEYWQKDLHTTWPDIARDLAR